MSEVKTMLTGANGRIVFDLLIEKEEVSLCCGGEAVSLTEDDIANLIDRLKELQAQLRGEAGDSSPPISVSLQVDPGNKKAGSRTWAKRVTGLNPKKGNGYGILGDFVPLEAAHPAGTLLLVCGTGGSWKNGTTSYVLLRVARGAEFEWSYGYQEFQGTGVELLATHDTEVDKQAILDKHPDLASAAGKPLFPIFVALRQAGL